MRTSLRQRVRPLLSLLLLACGLLLLYLTGAFLLQSVWAHRDPQFVPQRQQVALRPILEQEVLSPQDYELLFTQTGLSQSAAQALLDQGRAGVEQILETQQEFHREVTPQCVPLIGGQFTCEDLLQAPDGSRDYSVPLAPLKAGDILLSFSTHTLGWRHGHAGLVLDPEEALVLEAMQMGMDSTVISAQHWRRYSNFMVLRVKDATAEDRRSTVRFAWEHLNGSPYSLLSGVVGDKLQRHASEISVQCAYLPWRAWQSQQRDLDANGGRIVTVQDLAESPQLEVVQVYGIDPGLLSQRQSRTL